MIADVNDTVEECDATEVSPELQKPATKKMVPHSHENISELLIIFADLCRKKLY